jgi:hypothetical protein
LGFHSAHDRGRGLYISVQLILPYYATDLVLGFQLILAI